MELDGSDDLNLFNWVSFSFKMLIFRGVQCISRYKWSDIGAPINGRNSTGFTGVI